MATQDRDTFAQRPPRPTKPASGQGVLLSVLLFASVLPVMACGPEPQVVLEREHSGDGRAAEPPQVELDDECDGELDDENQAESDDERHGVLDDVLAQPPIDHAMPVIVIERSGGDLPDGFAGAVTINPGGPVERRLPGGSAEVIEETFQLADQAYERIALATWSYAHHDLPELLPPGSCAPERDEVVVTYTFTDHLGATVIDTCSHDVSNTALFEDLDAVFTISRP